MGAEHQLSKYVTNIEIHDFTDITKEFSLGVLNARFTKYNRVHSGLPNMRLGERKKDNLFSLPGGLKFVQQLKIKLLVNENVFHLR